MRREGREHACTQKDDTIREGGGGGARGWRLNSTPQFVWTRREDRDFERTKEKSTELYSYAQIFSSDVQICMTPAPRGGGIER